MKWIVVSRNRAVYRRDVGWLTYGMDCSSVVIVDALVYYFFRISQNNSRSFRTFWAAATTIQSDSNQARKKKKAERVLYYSSAMAFFIRVWFLVCFVVRVWAIWNDSEFWIPKFELGHTHTHNASTTCWECRALWAMRLYHRNDFMFSFQFYCLFGVLFVYPRGEIEQPISRVRTDLVSILHVRAACMSTNRHTRLLSVRFVSFKQFYFYFHSVQKS